MLCYWELLMGRIKRTGVRWSGFFWRNITFILIQLMCILKEMRKFYLIAEKKYV